MKLTAADNLIFVPVIAWSNAKQDRRICTVSVKNCFRFSEYALDRAVKAALGREWQYIRTSEETE